jgi:hypothetical protein
VLAAALAALALPAAGGALSAAKEPAARGPDLLANSGFEKRTKPWRKPPAFKLVHSTARAHSGSASLQSVRDASHPRDGNSGYYYLAFHHGGRYLAQAWVYLPRNYDGGPPRIDLDFYRGADVIDRHAGNPKLRGRWQRVWTEYSISPDDTAGFVVLRMVVKLPSVGKALFWDDATVRAART